MDAVAWRQRYDEVPTISTVCISSRTRQCRFLRPFLCFRSRIYTVENKHQRLSEYAEGMALPQDLLLEVALGWFERPGNHDAEPLCAGGKVFHESFLGNLHVRSGEWSMQEVELAVLPDRKTGVRDIDSLDVG